MQRYVIPLSVAGVVLASTSGALAVTMEMVTIGNPGNPGDTCFPLTMGAGSVGYVYSMGTFEVTAGQYSEFLNAVAKDDTYGLYSTEMQDNWWAPCGIQRSGSAPNYSYSVAADWADRPVTFADWGDAARFCNWLTNGQPTGSQGAGTTEDGLYTLNGAETGAELLAVTRNPGAGYVIPTFDEWYKAAYYDGNAAVYYTYPTGSDTVPDNLITDPDPGNNANYLGFDYALGGPYWRTEVGEFENSASPYGTFDQGGNVWEWNETKKWDTYRITMGSSFRHDETQMHVGNGAGSDPTTEDATQGFRVALVPEPDTLFLACGLAAPLLLKQRRREKS